MNPRPASSPVPGGGERTALAQLRWWAGHAEFIRRDHLFAEIDRLAALAASPPSPPQEDEGLAIIEVSMTEIREGDEVWVTAARDYVEGEWTKASRWDDTMTPFSGSSIALEGERGSPIVDPSATVLVRRAALASPVAEPRQGRLGLTRYEAKMIHAAAHFGIPPDAPMALLVALERLKVWAERSEWEARQENTAEPVAEPREDDIAVAWGQGYARGDEGGEVLPANAAHLRDDRRMADGSQVEVWGRSKLGEAQTVLKVRDGLEESYVVLSEPDARWLADTLAPQPQGEREAGMREAVEAAVERVARVLWADAVSNDYDYDWDSNRDQFMSLARAALEAAGAGPSTPEEER